MAKIKLFNQEEIIGILKMAACEGVTIGRGALSTPYPLQRRLKGCCIFF